MYYKFHGVILYQNLRRNCGAQTKVKAGFSQQIQRVGQVGACNQKCHTYSGNVDFFTETRNQKPKMDPGRRWQAAELERCWRKEERAHTLATAQGWRSYRTGFGKLD